MSEEAKLEIQVSRVKEEGIDIAGELPSTVFELPEDDDTVSAPNVLSYTLRVSQVGDSILVQGRCSSVFRCRCDRCLVYFDLPLGESNVCHYLEPPLPDFVDLTPNVREDILLSLPQKYLCDDDCKGLCSNCGQNLNVRQCGCEPPAADSGLWGQLDGLKV